MNFSKIIAAVFFVLAAPGFSYAKKTRAAVPPVVVPGKLAPSIVMLGDSLTEGYSLSKKYSYPSLVQNKFNSDGIKVKVINAGISGSTTASGPSRLKWLLKGKPKVLLLALGANDGLRGFKVEATRKNLSRTIELAQKAGVAVVLAGMQLPPNYGKSYSEQFSRIYPELAKKYKVDLIPFLLAGVAGNSVLNLPDGIHPNEQGYVIVADLVYPYLKRALNGRIKKTKDVQ